MKNLPKILSSFIIAFSASAAKADTPVPVDPEFDAILALDIGDLTVTSAAKRAQKLSDVPSAIYVITQEDLHRSGATSIPEALRMVPGLDVAQAGSNRWAISARGFNNVLENKLLVLIDGRSIYTPIYSGTYWDDQSTMIEDIERIEVIRGPGASLWGSNAVNGTINIITKRAADTQGNYVSAAAGTEENFVEGRHGGTYDDGGFYRAYGQYQSYGPSERPNGNDNHDDWYRARSGFRMDGKGKDTDSYTVEGDLYGGRQEAQISIPQPVAPYILNSISDNPSYGGNILARWNHDVSKDSHISVQGYVDHYSRLEANVGQHVNTADLEFQQDIALNERNKFIWGAGGRVSMDDLKGTFSVGFNDEQSNHEVVNLFAQDEYAIIPNKLYFTLGSKFEYNDFTGFEVQPSTRLSWHPVENQTVWGAISRAVRMPSDVEEDVSLVSSVIPGAPPRVTRIFGSPDLKSEELLAYEIGHRIQPTRNLSFDTSLYYNQFNNLETVGLPGTPYLSGGTLVVPYILDNLGQGHVLGAEEAVSWNVTSIWRLTGSYSYSKMSLETKPGSSTNLATTERRDPRSQFSIRSYLNLTDTVQWDNMFYYVDNINMPVKQYLRYDTRIGWLATPGIELSLVGRNLLKAEHQEFPASPQADIERSVLGRIAFKF